MRRNHTQASEQGFICVQCHLYVSCAPDAAGVQNRNHCPGCLWSRHLDWRSAGDRLSICRAAMRPVGLTTKRGRNKYARERDGELMLIHQCTACGTVVINRIAADDSAVAILALFEASYETSAAFKATLDDSGVSILSARDGDLVRRRLFGNRHLSGMAAAAGGCD
jgi:hypothetical protein